VSVEVRVLIAPRQVIEDRTLRIEVAAPVPLRTLLAELPLSPDERRDVFVEEDAGVSLRPGLAVLVNGRNVMHSTGLETEIRDRDRVSVIHGISGG
jgi:sulfur carrier protein ThiS